MIDTARTVAFEGSPENYFMLTFFAVLMAIVAIAIALPASPGLHDSFVIRLVFYSIAVIFLMCAVAALAQVPNARGTVFTISPQGIHDTRIAAETIPWSAIENISTWAFGSFSAMVVKLDPAAERRLSLTLMSRLTRRPNSWFGADGLAIGPVGLKTGYDAMFDTAVAFWRAHHHPA
jgi:hypothetical protein